MSEEKKVMSASEQFEARAKAGKRYMDSEIEGVPVSVELVSWDIMDSTRQPTMTEEGLHTIVFAHVVDPVTKQPIYTPAEAKKSKLHAVTVAAYVQKFIESNSTPAKSMEEMLKN